MQLLKIKTFLIFAVLAFAAKPFLGFSIDSWILAGKTDTNIIVKAFTKRKQEFVENSEFDIIAIQQRFSNPFISLSLLFSFFLNILFPKALCFGKTVTNGVLANIHLSLFPPQHRYLLAGKLTI
jgi:hypothetical protein